MKKQYKIFISEIVDGQKTKEDIEFGPFKSKRKAEEFMMLQKIISDKGGSFTLLIKRTR